MSYYKLPYELVRTAKNTDTDDGRPAGRITYKKRRKLLGKWPIRAGFIQGGNASQRAGTHQVNIGLTLRYQLLGAVI